MRAIQRLTASVFFLLALAAPSFASSADSDGWIYLRGGASIAPDERVVEVLAVGDVMTGRGLAGTR
ncbi:MAG TPA: hypothetical protein VFI11_03790, partial [Anaerolineales bacterium]|nr:hypothetical protein [Anaerolineales bacterium]